MSDSATEAVFSPDEARALASVLDQLIPPDTERGMPGAGEIGLAVYLAEKAPDLAPTIREGLAALGELAAGRGAGSFDGLSDTDRPEVLNEFAAVQPGFLPGLIFHTYVGYYQQARVVEALGLEARPPFPKGYEMTPVDLDALLKDVRARKKMFRSS